MPKVNRVVAAKDYPEKGIKKGDTYYWWKFRFGGKHMQLTPPKASQLTQSDYLSRAYEIQERIADLPADSSLKDEVDSIVSELREMAEECEEKKSNMPDSLQESSTGELLENRANACNEAADGLENIDIEDFEEDEGQRDNTPCTDCDGTGKVTLDGEADEQDCMVCDGSGEVTDDGADAKNSEGQTEDEYWEAKKEEVQNEFNFDIE